MRLETINTEEGGVTIIEDTYILAAMVTLDPAIRYYPVIDSSGRVAFSVTGTRKELLQRVYDETLPH